jgi:hypothetical protein
MEKISSKHFHQCILGNWKFSIVKRVMTKNFQMPNLQWSKFIHHQWPKTFIHQTIGEEMLSLWLCQQKGFRSRTPCVDSCWWWLGGLRKSGSCGKVDVCKHTILE